MDGDAELTTPTVTLAKASRADLDEVARLLTSNSLPLDGVGDSIERLIVAREDGRIVGCIGLELYGKKALLRSAAVSDDLKGQGIGRMLVDEILAEAARERAEAVYLLTTTAENYFTAFGFERIERAQVPAELDASEELKGACPASAVVMRKRLA
jgi:amino-acid N-acetyltransferase